MASGESPSGTLAITARLAVSTTTSAFAVWSLEVESRAVGGQRDAAGLLPELERRGDLVRGGIDDRKVAEPSLET